MNRINRTSINMISSVAGYGIPMIVNFLSIPLLIRSLGEVAFGLQGIVSIIIGYFTVLDLGLAWPITKYLAEDHAKNDIENENRMLNTTLQLYILIGLIGMIIIISSSGLLASKIFKVPGNMVSTAIQVFSLAGFGFLFSIGISWGEAIGMGLQRFEFTYGVKIINTVFGVGIGLIAVWAGFGVIGFVFIRIVVSFFSFMIYWLLLKHLLPTFKIHFGFDRNTIRRVGGYVGYGALNRIFGGFISSLDKTLIGTWIGIAATGIYSVPIMIVNSLSYSVSYTLGFFFPMSSELYTLGQLERLNEIFILSTRFIAALGSMIFIPLVVFGDLFLKLWVGPSVAVRVNDVLRLLAISGFIGTLSTTLANNLVVGIGRMRQFTIYSSIRALIFGSSCYFFIKAFGLYGAAIAWLIANIIDVLFLLFVLYRVLCISPFVIFIQAYLRPISLGLALCLVFILINNFVSTLFGLIFEIIIFELAYIIIGFRISIFGMTEKRAVLGLLGIISKKVI